MSHSKKPPLTSSSHTLPFDRLSPRDFERLCLWLVRREGFREAEHLGASGNDQGIDVAASRDGHRWGFQCKRWRRFRTAEALQELDRQLAQPAEDRVQVYVLVAPCDVSLRARRKLRERAAGRLKCRIWSGSELDEMVKRHLEILREFFSLATADLAARLSPFGRQFQSIPALPPHHIPRSEDLDNLTSLLVSSTAEATAVPIAIHGIAGVGKSTLATTVARAAAVRHRFVDGVFWLPLGQSPDVASILALAANWLGPPHSPGSIGDARAILDSALQGKRCLLVLDDVWDSAHVAPFLGLGTQTQILFTTRDTRAATDLGARDYPIEPLSKRAAIELLAAWAAIPPSHLPKSADDIAVECGRLPLALAMIGAAARRRPKRWVSALQHLKHRDLELIAREFPHYRYPNVMRAIDASVGLLPDRLRRLYLGFAVFDRHASVPEDLLLSYWVDRGLTVSEADDSLDTLEDLSLARRRWSESGTLVSWHDLQHDYVASQSSHTEREHQRFVDFLRKSHDAARLSSAATNYFWSWLGHHLTECGRVSELCSFLVDPKWLEHKLAATSIYALLQDYLRVPPNNLRPDVVAVWRVIDEYGHAFHSKPALLYQTIHNRLAFAWGPDTELGRNLHRLDRHPRGRWLRSADSLPETDLSRRESVHLRTIAGHDRWNGKNYGTVFSVDLSPDDELVATASRDESVGLWDVQTGEPKAFLPTGHWVQSVAFSPDGGHLAAGGADGVTRLWRLATRGEPRELGPAGGKVWSVSFSPDGQTLATVDQSQVCLWQFRDGTLDRRLESTVRSIRGTTFSPSGDTLACVGDDFVVASEPIPNGVRLSSSGSRRVELNIWHLDSSIRRTFVPPKELVEGVGRSVAFGTDGSIVAAVYGGFVCLWDVATGSVVGTLKSTFHSRRERFEYAEDAICFSPDGRFLARSDGSAVEFWDVGSFEHVGCLSLHDDQWGEGSVRFSRDGRVVVCSHDTGCRVWTVGALDELKILRSTARDSETKSQNAATFSDTGRVLAMSTAAAIRTWEVSSGREIRHIASTASNDLALSSQGNVLAGVDLHARSVAVWDLMAPSGVRTFEVGHPLDGFDPTIVAAVSQDGTRVVIGADDGRVREFSIGTGRLLMTLVPECAIDAVAYCGERYLASVDVLGNLWMWERNDAKLRFRIETGSSGSGRKLMISPDRKLLALAHGGSVKVFDPESGSRLATLSEDNHLGWIHGLSFAPRGRFVLAAGRHGISVWETHGWKMIASMETGPPLTAATFKTGARSDRPVVLVNYWVADEHEPTLRSFELV